MLNRCGLWVVGCGLWCVSIKHLAFLDLLDVAEFSVSRRRDVFTNGQSATSDSIDALFASADMNLSRTAADAAHRGVRRTSDVSYRGLSAIDGGNRASGLMAGSGTGANGIGGGVGGAYFEWPSRAEVLPICRPIVVATATNELAVGLRAAPYVARSDLNSNSNAMNLSARKPVPADERCEQVIENAWTLVTTAFTFSRERREIGS